MVTLTKKVIELATSKGFKFPTDWVAKNVKGILENQVYLGHMVSHKTQTKSFKNKKPMAIPKEDWIVVRILMKPLLMKKPLRLYRSLSA